MDKETEEKIADGRIRILSPLEFHYTTSESDEECHVVDLSLFQGSGACSCQHFQFRIEPHLRRGKIQPHEAGSQCKHIVISKLILGDRLIKATIKSYSDEAKKAIAKKNALKANAPQEAKPATT